MNWDARRALAPRHDSPSGVSTSAYRLAFCIHRYFEFGGLQRDLKRVATACAALGHDVHVLTACWNGDAPQGITVHLLDARSLTNHGRRLAFARSVAQFLRSESFDCVIGFDKMPGLDVYWAGDTCLAGRVHAVAAWLPRYRAYLGLEVAVLGQSSGTEILVLAEPEKEAIARHYRPNLEGMHLLPPGIDRARLEAPVGLRDDGRSLRSELGLAPGERMLLTVASSFHTKGVDRCVRALAALPSDLRNRARLVVVGNGRPEPIQRLARRLGLAERILFAGGREDVGRFYRGADLLVHPARIETAGHTLLEAMVCGLPVLATQNCGYAHHVQAAQAGLICPQPFRQWVLNRLLAQMLGSNLHALWRANARAYCESQDLYSLVDRTVEVICARARRNRNTAQVRRAA